VSWVGVGLCAIGFVGYFPLYFMVADTDRASWRVDLYATSVSAAVAVGAMLAALRPIQRRLRMTRYTKALIRDDLD
jgi:hypothetical protein